MFLKIVKDSTVVDALEELSYVRQNPRNKTIIMCDPEFANGIISSDGSVIWHLKGLPEFSSGDFETVEAIEVCEDEFNSINQQLYSGEEIVEEVRKTLTTTEMMEKIEELTEEIIKLKQQLASN